MVRSGIAIIFAMGLLLRTELQALHDAIAAHLALAKQVRDQLLGELDAGVEDAGR